MSRSFTAGTSEKAYADTLDILEAECNALKHTVAGITAEDWARPTRLRVSASHPYWNARFPILQ